MNSSKTNKKSIIFIFIAIIISFGFANRVNAVKVTYPSSKYICWNRDTGNYIKSVANYNDCISSKQWTDKPKKIGNDYAYCVHWRLNFNINNTYKAYGDADWPKKSQKAIETGYIIKLVNSDSTLTTSDEKYSYTAATLNTYFSKYLNSGSSYNFYSNTKMKNYIDNARKYYTDNVKGKTSTSLPAISFSVTDKVLNYSDKKYISKKVSVTGLQAYYGHESDKVTYTLTTNNSDKIKLCTSSLGTNCKSSITIPDGSTSYNFYILAENVTYKDTVKITVTGKNSSTYPSSIRYYDTIANNMQNLLKEDSFTVNRSRTASYNFTVPNLVNHQIVGYKVNENGESLEGAVIEIYKDDPAISSNLLHSNYGKGSFVRYESSLVAEDDDDFFKHSYYVVEKSAPDGYVFDRNNNVNKIYEKNTITSNSSEVCYYKGNADTDELVEADMERCNFENYIYMCKSSEGEIKELDESGNCEFTVPEVDNNGDSESGDNTEQNPGNSGSDSGNNNENTEIIGDEDTPPTDNGGVTPPGGNDSDSGEDSDTPQQPTITYTKICYNKSKKIEADESYCKDVENYVKVSDYNGNLSVVVPNKKNLVKISKRSITGDDELAGAVLKVCTKAEYDKNKENCEVAKTIDGIEMTWVSSDMVHEISGIKKGTYYIVETIPPRGYAKTTIATEFSIDESGSVKTGNRTITNDDFVNNKDVIVIKNNLNSIYISKQDITTSKELPGAKLTICRSYLDENNQYQILKDQYTDECIEAVLTDGTVASWISGNEVKRISGLGQGTYFLVEMAAPTNYSTAESILFTLKADGTLVDKDGKSLKDNKLIMKDVPINNEATGSLSLYLVIGILSLVIIGGVGSYYYIIKPKKSLKNSIDKN